MQAFLYPLIVIAGVLQALGNSMNAQLNQSLRNPWLASLVSFLLIIAFFVCAFAVFMGLVFVSKIGAGAFNGTLITANIIASLVIDHYGLLNMPEHPISIPRVIGGALMVVGISLISRF